MARTNRQLTTREQKFITEYLRTGNAYRSAINAGYTEPTAKTKSSGWVGNSKKKASNKTLWRALQKRLKKFRAKHEEEDDRLIREYNRLAYFDIRKLYKKDGSLKKVVDLDDDTAAAVVGLDVIITASGKPDQKDLIKKYKMADKKGALDSIAKIEGRFAAQKHELTGKGGGPIKSITANMTPEEAARIYRECL